METIIGPWGDSPKNGERNRKDCGMIISFVHIYIYISLNLINPNPKPSYKMRFEPAN